jgi:hypothetical protein
MKRKRPVFFSFQFFSQEMARCERGGNLTLLLGLLILICLLWVTFTSFYIISQENGHRNQSHFRSSKSNLSNIWISSRSLEILQNQDLASGVIEKLSPKSILVGEFLVGDFFRVSHPKAGWILVRPEELIRIERVTGNPDISLNYSEDFCSSVLHLTPASDTIEKLLSWQNQWPIGNGKFGTLVGGSYSVNVMPFSLEGFYVGSSDVKPEESSNPKESFNQSRMLLVRGEFEASQEAFSSAIRRKPMATFQSIFDLVLFFSPSPLQRPLNPQTSRAAIPNIRSRSEIFFDLQSTLFGRRLPLTNGIISAENSRLVYEANLLKANEGVSMSSHVVANSRTYHTHSRTWFASTPDDVIVGKLECLSSEEEDDGCLNVVIHPTRDKRPSQSSSVFRISTWEQRRDYSHSGFKGSIKSINLLRSS